MAVQLHDRMDNGEDIPEPFIYTEAPRVPRQMIDVINYTERSVCRNPDKFRQIWTKEAFKGM